MATVMPTETYPKIYMVNTTEYTIHNKAEDDSFKASPLYASNITVKTYPKTLSLGNHRIVVRNAAEEASARDRYGMS